MTDRELLEMAARAAGVNATWSEWTTGRVAEFGCIKYQKHEALRVNGKVWNPLTDDGDALRLMVGLGLRLSVANDLRVVFCTSADRETYQAAEGFGSDKLAATRRAIVSAAAAIGSKHE